MPDFTLDHVIIAVRDLEAATEDYVALLGRRPSWRGEHPLYGTANTLFRIDNTYIELLAPSAGKPKDKRWRGELERALEERGDGPYALAIGTRDIKRAVKTLRHNGIEIADPRDGDGRDIATGAVRAWRNAWASPSTTNGLRLLLIEHRSPPDALPIAAPDADDSAYVTRLDHVVILSADLEAARRVWSDGIEARLALDRTFPERNTRILFYRLGDATIEISGGAEQPEEGLGKPDRLWGFAWGVGNIEATCRRLADRGIETGGPRRGVKPGTLVATVKGPQTHGVATLLIEHTPESFAPQSRAPHDAAYDNAPERRAFNGARLQRVIIATDDVASALIAWRSTLALPETRANETNAARLDAGNMAIELVQPVPGSPLAAVAAERGTGMAGLVIEVDDLAAAVATLRANGIDVELQTESATGRPTASLERTQTNGVPVQIVGR
jgi:catechol 2,3-dioxygenase-like lactoylglutathione lyase family enzyme